MPPWPHPIALQVCNNKMHTCHLLSQFNPSKGKNILFAPSNSTIPMKSSITFLLQFLFFSLTHLTIFSLSTSQPRKETASQYGLENILHQLSQWRNYQLSSQNTNQNINTIIAWILSFITAAFSSACGVGGGSLFLPILTVVAGLSLKSATAFNSFMVSAGALCNVIYALCFLNKSLVNYEITLLSQPCMLLGVSIGVLCNFMFPEWLITALFAVILAISTAKTVQSGCKIWRSESEGIVRVEVEESESSGADAPLLMDHKEGKGGGNSDFVLWKDLVVLVMIWMCFFVLHILLGDKNGKGLIDIKPCGLTYWLITISQIPIAIGFTSYILHTKRKKHEHAKDVCNPNKIQSGVTKGKYESFPRYVFSLAAMLTGALSGLFGIGGGLILNPAFLQIGLPPQAAAATSSLMVLFSASMSMVQYILLGMKRIDEAVKYGLLSLAASTIGLVIMHRIIAKSGRVSLVVFMVSLVMALSTIIITLFGVLDVWRQITNGEYMGFKLLC